MKKTIILVIFLAMILPLFLFSCKSDNGQESHIKSEVIAAGMREYIGKTIGGKELKSSYAEIDSIEKRSDGSYWVCGKISMRDIYNTKYVNRYGVEVKGYGKNWIAGEFEYANTIWKEE